MELYVVSPRDSFLKKSIVNRGFSNSTPALLKQTALLYIAENVIFTKRADNDCNRAMLSCSFSKHQIAKIYL